MGNWNIDRIPNQTGKIAIVTGANSGIGYETTLRLAEKGMTVVLACRDWEKGKEARQKIMHIVRDAKLQIMEIDLADLASVASFAETFKKKFTQLDLLVNNAGVMMPPYEITVDGFEKQLATNYLGHFALTGYLISLLKTTANARVVTLSSLSYKWAEIEFDDLHFKNGYQKNKAYGQSKRACLVFAYELQRRLTAYGHDTTSLAAHPGLSNTNLDRYFPEWLRPLGNLFLQKAAKGALPVLYAATAPTANGGDFIGPNGLLEIRGFPTKVDSDSSSKDVEIAQRLWAESEVLTGVNYLSN